MAKSMGWRSRLLLSVMGLTSIAALPTTVIFFVGMMPTIIVRFTDKKKSRTRVFTVGFMNFAACFPFWFDLMHKGHTFPNAIELIGNPMTIVIMYFGAGMGYLIEWCLAGFVGGLLIARGKKKLDDIIKMQEVLTDRWGAEVSGQISLDPDGFPIDIQKH